MDSKTSSLLTNERIQKFKNLYFEKFNVLLTDEETTRMATDLINLVRVLIKSKKGEAKRST